MANAKFSNYDFVMLQIKAIDGSIINLFGDAKAAEKLEESGYKISSCDDEIEQPFIDEFMKFMDIVKFLDEYVGRHGVWGGVHLARKD